jgi:hypothetical protein
MLLPDSALWAETVRRLRYELAALPTQDRSWLATQVARVGRLQTELDQMFRAANGVSACTVCLGGCCSRAKHHITLTNLLGYLLAGEEPPSPDFSLECPLLGPRGCRLPVERRPFNCIIFLCEQIDNCLTEAQRQLFSEVETALRNTYHAIAERCPGASLRGLLIAATRVGDRPLLTR